MILEITRLIGTLRPELLRDTVPTVVCIRTTRPVFLVFGRDPRRPICAVHFGPADSLERTFAVLSRLHALVPDLVPEPLVHTALNGDRDHHVLVLSGLAGTPWFRLSEKYRGPGQWATLRTKAMEALERLHAAIRTVPEWQLSIRPGDALRDRLAWCLGAGVELSAPIQRAVEESAAALDGAGNVRHFWQHGDFCVNNLLISPRGVHVIDFDEFGSTAMPLHDEIGLALSLHDLEAAAGLRDRRPRDEIAACVRTAHEAGAMKAEHLPGLVWHHLLFRITRCAASPLRARARAALIETALTFARAPELFLPAR